MSISAPDRSEQLTISKTEMLAVAEEILMELARQQAREEFHLDD
ncbi:MAG: hypothetical protein JWQ19_588 [Subtercola sp.]|nr:hypothetical protein [Subtercola sp.]